MMQDENGNEAITHRDVLSMINEVIVEVKEEMRVQKRQDEFIGAKVKLGTFDQIEYQCFSRSSILPSGLIRTKIWYGISRIASQWKKSFHILLLVRERYPAIRTVRYLNHGTGFDLVGDENEYRPLTYYVPKLLWFLNRQKEEGVDIPLILHAGETLGDGTEADMNVYDAILLGTKRIGHGYLQRVFS
jgi:adenosine deaminase CECR1